MSRTGCPMWALAPGIPSSGLQQPGSSGLTETDTGTYTANERDARYSKRALI